jgi:hypothetical protein
MTEQPPRTEEGMTEQSGPTPQEVANLPQDERAAVAVAGLSNLAPEAQDAVLKSAGVSRQLPDPTPSTTDKVWRTIVLSFSIVLVGAFLGIALVATGAVQFLFGQPGTDDVMLTVFTTAAGFLAGLLSPSPVTDTTGGGGS